MPVIDAIQAKLPTQGLLIENTFLFTGPNNETMFQVNLSKVYRPIMNLKEFKVLVSKYSPNCLLLAAVENIELY